MGVGPLGLALLDAFAYGARCHKLWMLKVKRGSRGVLNIASFSFCIDFHIIEVKVLNAAATNSIVVCGCFLVAWNY